MLEILVVCVIVLLLLTILMFFTGGCILALYIKGKAKLVEKPIVNKVEVSEEEIKQAEKVNKQWDNMLSYTGNIKGVKND